MFRGIGSERKKLPPKPAGELLSNTWFGGSRYQEKFKKGKDVKVVYIVSEVRGSYLRQNSNILITPTPKLASRVSPPNKQNQKQRGD